MLIVSYLCRNLLLSKLITKSSYLTTNSYEWLTLKCKYPSCVNVLHHLHISKHNTIQSKETVYLIMGIMYLTICSKQLLILNLLIPQLHQNLIFSNNVFLLIYFSFWIYFYQIQLFNYFNLILVSYDKNSLIFYAMFFQIKYRIIWDMFFYLIWL